MAELLSGRYEVGPVLSGSALVVVHRGRDLQLDRDVSVTFLRQDPADDEARAGLFTATVSVRAELSHPGIAGVYDAGAGEFDGATVRWAVGEFVEAPSVAEFSPTGRQAAQWATTMLDIAEQVAEAMQHAHSDGVVHGSLGPATVLLEERADGGLRACVTGFGPQAADLAVLSDPALTRRMWQLFTEQLECPSPEQQAGRAPTRRSDIYGFGCVLAALLGRVERAAGGAGDDTARLASLTRVARQARSERPTDRQHSFAVVSEQLRGIRATNSLDPVDIVTDVAARVGTSPATMILPFALQTGGPASGGPAPGGVEPTARVEPAPVTERLTYLPVGQAKRAPGRPSAAPRRSRRRSPGARLFAVLCLVVLLASGIGWGVSQSRSEASSESVTIPSVAGQELGAASSLLGSLGLSLGGQVQRPDPSIAVGLVVATEPAAGSQVAAGHAVMLVISSGPDVRSVPQLQALSLAAAQEALSSAGLVAGKIMQRDGLAEAGSVLDSDPPFGASVSAGAVIDIVVASGNQRVPRGLAGQAGVAASQQLAAAGLAPQLLSRASSEVATGVVIEVVPGEGSSLPLGTIVTLVVSEYTPAPPAATPSISPSPAAPVRPTSVPPTGQTSSPSTTPPTTPPAAGQNRDGDA